MESHKITNHSNPDIKEDAIEIKDKEENDKSIEVKAKTPKKIAEKGNTQTNVICEFCKNEVSKSYKKHFEMCKDLHHFVKDGSVCTLCDKTFKVSKIYVHLQKKHANEINKNANEPELTQVNTEKDEQPKITEIENISKEIVEESNVEQTPLEKKTSKRTRRSKLVEKSTVQENPTISILSSPKKSVNDDIEEILKSPKRSTNEDSKEDQNNDSESFPYELTETSTPSVLDHSKSNTNKRKRFDVTDDYDAILQFPEHKLRKVTVDLSRVDPSSDYASTMDGEEEMEEAEPLVYKSFSKKNSEKNNLDETLPISKKYPVSAKRERNDFSISETIDKFPLGSSSPFVNLDDSTYGMGKDPFMITEIWICPICDQGADSEKKVRDHLHYFHKYTKEKQSKKQLQIQRKPIL